MTRRTTRLAGALALALALSQGAPQAAADGTDMVFREGALENVETGRAVVYERTLRAPAAAPEEAAADETGRILLALVDLEAREGRAALLTIEREDGRARRLDPFPAGARAGNPVLLAFLELTTRSVAEATGGSPFYIRNRIKDAFRAGGETAPAAADYAEAEAPVTRIAYRPFLDDPNGAALGEFAGLTISFDVAETVPGGFLRFQATTGGEDAVYLERIAYAGETAADAEEDAE